VNRIRHVVPRRLAGLPGVPADAMEILHRALSNAPQDRYIDAAALALDLEAITLGRPLVLDLAWQWRGRTLSRRIAIALLALLLSLTLMGVAWSVWPRSKFKQPVTDFGLPKMTNSLGMTLVKTPAASFGMGAPANADLRGDDERAHTVRISIPFWISTKEVTRAQYRQIMQTPPPTPGVDEQLPVTGVSWNQAMEFCRSLGEREACRYRLPFESEWEYACGAGSNAPWSGTGDVEDMGWTAPNSGGRLHHPGEKQYNHWGLHDMHGNAAEWCWDWYNRIYPTTEVDPVFRDRTGLRVVRGGSYARAADKSRTSARDGERPDSLRADLGFRVVREDPDAPSPPLDEH